MARNPRYELYSLNIVLISLMQSLVYANKPLGVRISENSVIIKRKKNTFPERGVSLFISETYLHDSVLLEEEE
jgi:hypothetical protein